jgi:hypothetical protein
LLCLVTLLVATRLVCEPRWRAGADDPDQADLSHRLHLKAGTGWPGSTMTVDGSPQRPHCLTTFVGSFRIGLLVAATACSACALSSALLSGGPRRRCFIGWSIVLDVAEAGFARQSTSFG